MVKVKSRYLLFEIRWGDDRKIEDTKEAIKKAVSNSLLDNFGAWGASCSERLMYYNHATFVGLIRTDRPRFRLVWAALTLVTKIDTCPASFTVLHVGGTIKQCAKFGIKYDRALLAAEKQLAEEEEQERGEEIEEEEEEMGNDREEGKKKQKRKVDSKRKRETQQ